MRDSVVSSETLEAEAEEVSETQRKINISVRSCYLATAIKIENTYFMLYGMAECVN
jgi:hypothetical protein